MRVDLHIHTTASDGALAPAAVVQAAARGKLDVIAVSDHDTTAGMEEAVAASRDLPLRVIPAIELSTSRNGREIHILSYFIDLASPALREHEERARTARLRRIETMVGRLRDVGAPVEVEAVLAAAGGDFGVVGRPHLAQALVEAGHASSISEAFDRWIGDSHRAFVPNTLLDAAEGVALAREIGGIAVWAHPPGDLADALLPELVRAGLQGIETYRPQSQPDHVRRLEGLARTTGLYTTGGSDWHSPERNGPLGSFTVPADRISAFLEAGGI